MKEIPIAKIKKSLIIACLKNKPRFFLPYLLSKNVKTGFSNKINFYKFFKLRLKCAHQCSKEPLRLVIEKPKWEKEEGYIHYSFYDKVHKFDRIYIRVKESDNNICFDLLPF